MLRKILSLMALTAVLVVWVKMLYVEDVLGKSVNL